MLNIQYKNSTRTTQKKERIKEVEEVKEDITWNRLKREGETLYDYLIHNYDKLFDGDNIKHCYIRDGIYCNIADTDEIYEKYGQDIQLELLPWIQNEFNENRIFDKTLWKPFRDSYTLYHMYLGYRKLFRYKHYIFQLSMESECSDFDCKYCIDYIDNIEPVITPHFCLALYGWKEENSDMLQPYKMTIIPIDNMMLDKHWQIK